MSCLDHGVGEEPLAVGVQALARLVENQELRFVDQRLGQGEPSEHALAVARDRLSSAIGQAEPIDQLRHSAAQGGGGNSGKCAVEPEQIRSVQVLWEARRFVDVADARERAAVVGRPSQATDAAGGRAAEGKEQFDQGRLAGAVRPDQAEDLAALQPQADPVDRQEARAERPAGVAFDDVDEFRGGVLAHGLGPWLGFAALSACPE